MTGGAGGLDDEHVALAYVLQDADEGVVVGELEHLGLSHRYPQVVANGLGQLRMGIAGKHNHLVVNADHAEPPGKRGLLYRVGGCLPEFPHARQPEEVSNADEL